MTNSCHIEDFLLQEHARWKLRRLTNIESKDLGWSSDASRSDKALRHVLLSSILREIRKREYIGKS